MLCVNLVEISINLITTYLWLPVPPNDMREALTPPFPLTYHRKTFATINCIINAVAQTLNPKAAKRHMFLKPMSTNGGH